MNILKKHTPVLLFFALISFGYFLPVIQGKKIETHDVKTWQGMSKEISDYRDQTGDEPLWTNSMFSGMPAYQISTYYKANLIQYVDKIIMKSFPRPVNILFLYLLGFYLLLVSLNVDYRISAVGAIAFAFSSYFFIIIQAGHMSKAHAIAYMPMVLASVMFTYRKKMFLGGVLTALTVALEIYCNHFQITYYLFLVLLLIGINEFIRNLRLDIKHKKDTSKLIHIPEFIKRSFVLLIAGLLASGTAFTRLATTMEYGEESIRGKSELTDNIDNKTSGLDKDYATQWSYGIAETMTLLIPNFHGGASQGALSMDSELYKTIKRSPNAKKIIKQVPLYWGDQPIVNGPTYAGSIVLFLFVFGIFFIKSTIRNWILFATIMSILLSWGKNFMFLTDLFLNYFPAYNKFRAVSTILIIAELTIPLLGFYALNKLIKDDNLLIVDKKKYLKLAFYITGGITLVFALMPSLFFDFVGVQDSRLEKMGWPIQALQTDRATLLSNDAWRSFFFILLSFSTLWFFLKKKSEKIDISKQVILVIGLLVLVDMWTINKRYLNDDIFVRASKIDRPYSKTAADQQILKDKTLNYRVFNQSVSTFNDASTSYFHKSIGGYHGAKLKRYQEVIEKHISQGNMKVINMLNTKYFISQDGKVQLNPGALGNAWYVKKVDIVKNADEEIAALKDFNPKLTALLDERYVSYFSDIYKSSEISSNLLIDSSNHLNSTIILQEYEPNYLKYKSNSESRGTIVFSEIFYDKGWNAYVNGKLQPHFRVNYILRGMNIDSGEHVIEFKFEPLTYHNGEKISLASSITLLLLLFLSLIKEYRR